MKQPEKPPRTMTTDAETSTMVKVARLLDALPPPVRIRVIRWLGDKFIPVTLPEVVNADSQ